MINNICVSNIICPYCEYKDEDSDEIQYSKEDFIMDCDNCKKEFRVLRCYSIEYSTYKINETN